MEAFDVANKDVANKQEAHLRRRRTDHAERERVDLSSWEEVMWDYIARQSRQEFR